MKRRSTVPPKVFGPTAKAAKEAEEITLEQEQEARAAAQALWKKMESDNVKAALEQLTEYLGEWQFSENYTDVVEAYDRRISDWAVVFEFMKVYGTAKGIFTLDEEKEKQLAKFFESPSPHNVFLVDYQNQGTPLSTNSTASSAISGTDIDSVDKAPTSNIPDEPTKKSSARYEHSEVSFIRNNGKESLSIVRFSNAPDKHQEQTEEESTTVSGLRETVFVPSIGKESLRKARSLPKRFA